MSAAGYDHLTHAPLPDGALLLVGVFGETHVGTHLLQAARRLGINTTFCEATDAFRAPRWLVSATWRLAGHRPPKLRSFSTTVAGVCRSVRPRWLLTTGFAPIDARALRGIGELGIRRLNFLTDDPWNPQHFAPWFMAALPHYDHVFSPRLANISDLQALGCHDVQYLPFAYAPEVHFPEPPTTPDEWKRFGSDIVFAGGADPDRVPVLAELMRAGARVALYGGYWERYAETRSVAGGHADARTLRKAVGGAKVALCLVRRANRDGHVMRSFELPATGACVLVEYTVEHYTLFGPDLQAVVYFRNDVEMIDRLHWLLARDGERRRLASAARSLMLVGSNTYADRLAMMLGRDSLLARRQAAAADAAGAA